MTDWPSVAVAALVGFGGLYFGNSTRRRTETELKSLVAERRFPAYASLWAKTEPASPTRGALTEHERHELFRELTDWYYEAGNGMLLSESARNIYLKAKANLTCGVDGLVPTELKERVARSPDPDQVRSQASIDQLSLLRTALRNDIELSTEPYEEPINDCQAAFLRACKVDLSRPPWNRGLVQTTEQTSGGLRSEMPDG